MVEHGDLLFDLRHLKFSVCLRALHFRLTILSIFRHISFLLTHPGVFRLKSIGKDVKEMITLDQTGFSQRIDRILRPLGITRNMRAYSFLVEALTLIYEDEDRLNAVQKEIYMPIAENYDCSWKAIQSAIRRAVQASLLVNPTRLQEIAGYPLTGCPSAVQFLEMLYNALVRDV